MNGVFRLYVPGDSFFHRLAVGWKYLVLVVLVFPGIIAGSAWVSLGLLALALALVAACGVGVGYGWRISWGVLALAGLLFVVQWFSGQPALGVAVAANLLTAIYASRILTMSTPGPVLIDALVTAARPLRWTGLDPERFGLAVAIMVRSIPMLLDSFGQVRMAARARGRERHLFALVTPVVVRAVGLAQATGAGLAARGLGETTVGRD